MTTKDSQDAAKGILEALKVGPREYRGVYILGCVDRRVTFLAQQHRALNLVASLQIRDRIKLEKKTIGIIGGGLAGVTAAVAAAWLGAEVHLVEKNNHVMRLQHKSQRFVHPYIYDWPASGWRKEYTELPFLNWDAETADAIRRQITAEWERHRHELSINAHTSVRNAKITRESKDWILEWDNLEQGHSLSNKRVC